MNPLTRNILNNIIGTAILAAPMMTLPACNAFNEHLEECPEGARLRFVYDYNMEFANAFPSQVDCLTLLVYDENGNYLQTRTETSDVLADENYRMTLDLPAGKYTFVAYGGMACEESSFHFVQQPAPEHPLSSLEVEMDSNCLTHPVGTNLHPLFYGLLDFEVTDTEFTYTEGTVKMMKDTNNIRILLQQLNGDPVNDGDFNFTITDDNTLLDWENIPVEREPITYYPWTKGQAVAGEYEDGSEAVLAFAEFSTSRLYTGNEPRLVITRKSDGENIVNIPLINYLLLLKSQQFSRMDSQEFLDRESRWNMIFFLDKNDYWIRTHIVINDWVVRLNDNIDLGL